MDYLTFSQKLRELAVAACSLDNQIDSLGKQMEEDKLSLTAEQRREVSAKFKGIAGVIRSASNQARDLQINISPEVLT